MPKFSKTVVDADLRSNIFEDIFGVSSKGTISSNGDFTLENEYVKINDRQWGCILTDKNGVERYVRIGAIVAEERQDVTARELMAKEQKEYQDKQAEKAEKAKKNAEKAAKDKAAREKKKEEGE